MVLFAHKLRSSHPACRLPWMHPDPDKKGRAWGMGRAQGSGFRVQGFRVQGSGFRVQGSGFRVQGSGFRVQGSGFRV